MEPGLGGHHVQRLDQVRPPPRIYGNLTYGPLFKTWYDTGGKEGVEPPDAWKHIVALQDKAKTVGPDEQAKIAKEIYNLWVENLYDIGTVGLTAMDQGVVVVNKNLHNVPANLTKDWALRSPGNGKPKPGSSPSKTKAATNCAN